MITNSLNETECFLWEHNIRFIDNAKRHIFVKIESALRLIFASDEKFGVQWNECASLGCSIVFDF